MPAPVGNHWYFIGKEIHKFNRPITELGAGVHQMPLQPANVSHVASYSWVDMPRPTIVVPGSPRVWNEPSVPFTLPVDTREDHLGQASTHNVPFHLLEPLVASVQHMQPDFLFHSLHVVSDRAFLRGLLRWANGAVYLTDFRYDVQVVAKTMLCTRKIIREWHCNGGHGKGFERITTTASADAASLPAPMMDHARIIRYVGPCRASSRQPLTPQQTIAGLDLLIRYQVDACLPVQQESGIGNRSAEPHTIRQQRDVPTTCRVTLIPQQRELVEQSRIVELKSGAGKRKSAGAFWSAAYPQMLLSQTPHLFVGLHVAGTFSEVRKHALGHGKCDGTAPRAVRDLNALASTLRNIYETVLAQGDGAALSIVCVGGVLKLHRRCAWDTDPDALPDSMLELFRPTKSPGEAESRTGEDERNTRISAML
ncbi:hypothetical protein AURDEDRAFT_118776 [Auricularia subglabra TFB-10046 SS5]|nr:hypothetical protein AURDEDRAFT_118776 [Auricularia subglabra TFB-10046 SS5]